VVALLAFAAASCGGVGAGGGGAAPPVPAASGPETVTFAPSLGIDLASMRRTSSGVYWKDLKVGTGATARRTSSVSARYTGYLADGRIFDTTGSDTPVAFQLGGREVIRGWNDGIPGMKAGGIRRLVVPPELGYGTRGRGGVPPNAILIFDIQLVDVR
jgi:FKBP-type peptidyl-prolyl cis-trans isomerase FkpA